VAALRARLAIEDPGVPSGATYDESLAAAVARAQVRHGLTADGRVGPATIAALNVSAETRLAQIAANLERWRWTPRALPTPRIEINTADASLVLQDGVSPAMSMRAIVGKPSWRTPMFVDRVTAVVFNPPWNVPEKIARAEVWPKIRRDPGYLAREGFVVRPGGGLQQLPGPRCALGLIKFDLANPFGVYLHDTPSRSLFALDRRALSHGCMRLENPVELGKRLLATDPNWSENAVNLALLGGKTVRVPVARPVPVYVFHWTVFVDDEGAVQFRPDVYGWDAEIGRLLRTSRTPDRDGA
jgi:murein L,D-transpeptidase YcbB/YkuD